MSRVRIARALTLGLLALALVSAAYAGLREAGEAAAGEAGGVEDMVLGKQEVLESLPCFKCHSVGVLLDAPESGVFSHLLHSNFDVHCNQCHEVRGHEMPKIKTAVCSNCHGLKSFTYDEKFGAVTFNHEFHGMAFGCGDCHPRPFLMKKGATKMAMEPMYRGKFCGECHNGQMAFSSRDCMKCHKMG